MTRGCSTSAKCAPTKRSTSTGPASRARGLTPDEAQTAAAVPKAFSAGFDSEPQVLRFFGGALAHALEEPEQAERVVYFRGLEPVD